MNKSKISITIVSLLLLAGCNYRVAKQAVNGDGVTQQQDDSADAELYLKNPNLITYDIVAKKVFTNSCVGCHSVAGGNKGKVNLENYENVLKNIETVRDEVSGRDMPPRKQLSEFQINLILAWIDGGANENGKAQDPVVVAPPITPPGGSEPPPVTMPPPIATPDPVTSVPTDPKEITFAMIRKGLLEPSCWKCHSADVHKGDTTLETYADVKENMKDMWEDIMNGDMPRGKNAHLTDNQLKLFFDWYDAGYKENGDK